MQLPIFHRKALGVITPKGMQSPAGTMFEPAAPEMELTGPGLK